MKLSKTQQEVITLMQDSWELGCSHMWSTRCWLQKGHIGEGGKSKDIRCSTVSALVSKGLISRKGRKQGVMIFQLS